jgi:hypothetical protein
LVCEFDIKLISQRYCINTILVKKKRYNFSVRIKLYTKNLVRSQPEQKFPAMKTKKMKKKNFVKPAMLLIPITFVFACSPPKSVINSGKVATKNQVQFGTHYSVNVSTSPITQSIDGIKEIKGFADKDTFEFDKTLEHINATALAYCLDPIGYKTDFYLRYGLGHNIDLGYRYSGKAHMFDARYQFLGSNSTYQYSDYKGMYGSIGLQYGWQNYGFGDKRFDQIQRVFELKMSRKDISVPVIFSKSFGPEEKFGALSFGLIYTHSFVKYNVNPKNVYIRDNEGAQQMLAPLNAKANYGSYGSFIHVKAGYKFIYFNAGLTTYYQKYGTYQLLGGGNVTLKGWTFVPSYGVQFTILPRKKKTELRNM